MIQCYLFVSLFLTLREGIICGLVLQVNRELRKFFPRRRLQVEIGFQNFAALRLVGNSNYFIARFFSLKNITKFLPQFHFNVYKSLRIFVHARTSFCRFLFLNEFHSLPRYVVYIVYLQECVRILFSS